MKRATEAKVFSLLCRHYDAFIVEENINYCPTCRRFQVNYATAEKPYTWEHQYSREYTQTDEFSKKFIRAYIKHLSGEDAEYLEDESGDCLDDIRWQRDAILQTLVNSYPEIWRICAIDKDIYCLGCIDPDTNEVLCSFKIKGKFKKIKFDCIEAEFDTKFKRYDNLTKAIPHINKLIDNGRKNQYTYEEVDRMLKAKEELLRYELAEEKRKFIKSFADYIGESAAMFMADYMDGVTPETDVVTIRGEALEEPKDESNGMPDLLLNNDEYTGIKEVKPADYEQLRSAHPKVADVIDKLIEDPSLSLARYLDVLMSELDIIIDYSFRVYYRNGDCAYLIGEMGEEVYIGLKGTEHGHILVKSDDGWYHEIEDISSYCEYLRNGGGSLQYYNTLKTTN